MLFYLTTAFGFTCVGNERLRHTVITMTVYELRRTGG
jgi:hypothetical protein